MYKSKLIAEQIKKIRPLIKESSPQQKLKLMKLMKVALKEGFNERQALIQKLASTGEYDVSDLELATDEELEQLLSDEGQQGVAEGDSGAKYKVRSIGHDAKGDYYVSPSTGKKVYKKGVKVGDHENPKTGEHKGVAEAKKKKKSSRATGGYFFPGYGYYGSGDSGEGGGDGGGGESVEEVTKQSAIKQYQDIQNYKVNPSPKQDDKEFVKITVNRAKKAGMNESSDYLEEK